MKGRAQLGVAQGGITPETVEEVERQKIIGAGQGPGGEGLSDSDLDRLAMESQAIAADPRDLNVNLPVDELQEGMVGGINLGPREDPTLAAPDRRRQVGQAMRATSSITPFAEEIVDVPMRDVQGNLLPPTIDTAELKIEEDIALSQSYAPPAIDYGFNTGLELQKQFPSQATDANVFNVVSNTGQELTQALNEQALPALQSDSPVAMEYKQTLINAGLLDSESGQFTVTAGNALAITLLETFKGEQDVKDWMAMEEMDPTLSSTIPEPDEALRDLGMMLDEFGIIPLDVKTEINPEYERGQLFNSLVNKTTPNPNQLPSGAMAGFGGVQLSPEVKAFGDTINWAATQAMGFIEPVTVDGVKLYRMSQKAVSFYNRARDIIADLNPDNARKPSLTPNIEGVGMHHYLAKGFKKVGNVAIKSRRANDDSLQRKIMNYMGQIGNALNNNTSTIYQVMLDSILTFNVEPNGRITLLAPPMGDPTRSFATFKGQENERMYSTLPAAKALGLDKTKYDEHLQKARMRENMTEELAVAEANAIMAMKARKLIRNYMAINEFKNKVFYFPVAYASTNERFMYRNIILNPQDDKAVRNLIRNPQRTFIDLSKMNFNDELVQDFAYATGEMLLTTNDVEFYTGKRLKPKNMTMREITNVMRLALTDSDRNRQPNSPYQRWLKEGYRWKQMSMSDPKMTNFDKDFKTFDDPEAWGDTVSAYIDIVNYHNARQNAKRTAGVRSVFPDAEIEEYNYFIPNAEDSPEVARLNQAMQDARVIGDPEQIRLVEQEIVSKLGVIRKPIPQSNKPIFEVTTNAKADGRQSGMAIQAAQGRDVELSKRVGLIFSDETNVIPEGDIRDLFNENFSTIAVSGSALVYGDKEKKKQFWGEVIELLNKQNDKASLEKMLSRTPLMEHSYGKAAIYNHATVMKILNGTGFGAQILELGRTSGIEGYAATKDDPNAYRGLVNDFNSVISKALSQTIDIGHQKLIQRLGIAWSFLASETPRFYGPLGNVVFIGSTETKGTGRFITVPTTTDPSFQKEIKTRMPTGSARPPKATKKFNEITLKNERGEPDLFGNQVKFQLPVLVVQAVDAAILGRTILEVNEGRGKLGPKWSYFIHDAIVSDVRGIRDYRGAYNRNFKKLAIDPEGPEIVTGILEAFRDGYRSWIANLQSEAHPETTVLNQTGPYRAVHDFYADLDRKVKEGQTLSEVNARLYRSAKAAGWKGTNSVLTKLQLYNLVKSFLESTNAFGELNEWRNETRKREARYLKQIPKNVSNM